jgi:hypothetical protein
MEKTRAATRQGNVESSARADRVESDARWSREEKEGDGLREGKGRDSRRHKVDSMLVGLRMNRVAAGVYRKNHLCINIHFFNFNLNIHIKCSLDTWYSTGSAYKFNVS